MIHVTIIMANGCSSDYFTRLSPYPSKAESYLPSTVGGVFQIDLLDQRKAKRDLSDQRSENCLENINFL